MPYPRRLPRILDPLYDQMEERDRLAGLATTGTNVLTRGLFGRLRQQTLTAVTTFNLQIELEGEFMSFRVGIPNVSATPVTGVKVCVGVSAAVPAATHLVAIAPEQGEWIDLTFNGAATVDLAARSAEEVWSVTWSDPVFLPSVVRTDATTGRPLVLVRMEYPANSVASMPYNNLYNWRSTGPRVCRCSNQEVQGVTNKPAFTQANVYSSGGDEKAVVPLIQYITVARGHQVLIGGDSIPEGLGGSVRDMGAVQRAVLALSTSDRPIEYVNAGLHAQVPDVYSRLVVSLLAAVRPTILAYAPWSINDVPNGGMTAAGLRRLKGAFGRVMEGLRTAGLRPIVFLPEATPANSDKRPHGAGDQVRRDHNAFWLPRCTGAIVVKDTAAVVTGTRDASGQDQIKVGMTDPNDGVHFLDPGYDALAELWKPYLSLVQERLQ